MRCSPTGVSPNEAASTYCPGGMSVRARSALFEASTVVSAPAGTALAAVCVWTTCSSRMASLSEVPAGTGSAVTYTVVGLAAATARSSAPLA